jgi:ubiquinone/menaquinone biosynthesis C-methylase UbiE
MQRTLSQRLDRAAYRAQQISILAHCMLLQQAARVLARVERSRPDPEVLEGVRRRYRALLERDLDNVERGLYPRDLLFQIPLGDYLRALPSLLRDAPRTARRMRRGDYKDLPEGVDERQYPPYYRRNFHWQTDGYLSRRSAALYDLGVELLFHGTADVMRRQIIPPVTRFLAEQPGAARPPRLLDVACGTGRTLKQLAAAHPDLRYYGVDLSPYYVQEARRILADVADLSLLVENAEALPFVDGYFDVVTSVYLFHELPVNARRRVLAEAHRVLRPGGLLVIEDSAQPSDSPQLAGALQSFPREFHEPFYDDYLRHDLAELAAAAGFVVDSVEPHLVAKVLVARKPG